MAFNLAFKGLNTCSHIAHVNKQSLKGRHPIKNVHLRTDLTQLRTHNSSKRNNALRDLALIALIAARFVHIGRFLIM